jgi:hypothetical protein
MGTKSRALKEIWRLEPDCGVTNIRGRRRIRAGAGLSLQGARQEEVAAALLRDIESGPPQPDISQGKAEVPMSIVKRHLAESEVRMVLVEEICIDSGALVLDPKTDEVCFSADHDAYKNAFVAVFQAWAKGTIKGTAEQVFEAAKSVLEGWDAQRP